MALAIPLFAFSLFCSWFQCEVTTKMPFVKLDYGNSKALLNYIRGPGSTYPTSGYIDGPIAYTKLGPVLGYNMDIGKGRKIHAYTGVPYGEPPIGVLRFRKPIMRKPWRGIWQATSPSPFCPQINGEVMGMIRGQEDCLYLDIYTPKLPKLSRPATLPVIIWVPAGINIFGRSLTYGPKYFMQEDVVLVVMNMRVGVLGFLTTGDEASPGNWGLKDQALVVEWVHQNIHAFNGDASRIIIGGTSSGAYAAQSMLFTNYESRDHIKGIISMSGNMYANHGLDAVGRVKNASNAIARFAKCPTEDEGKSWEMVECLRKVDPYLLVAYQTNLYTNMPPSSLMLGPVLEPDVPGAYLSQLPEVLYERKQVPPIPLITTRTESENGHEFKHFRFTFLPILRLNWYKWMPTILRNVGFRSFKGEKANSSEESQLSLLKITRFYFNKPTPPQFILKKDFIAFVNLIDDSMYNAPLWKAINLHHKVAPTYSYISKHNTFTLSRTMEVTDRLFFPTQLGSSHATDFALLFNKSNVIPPLSNKPEFEIASRNLVNIIANFAAFGKPLYRDSKGSLHPVWQPITDMRRPLVLEVGLVHNLTMIKDPLCGTGRLNIWEHVKF